MDLAALTRAFDPFPDIQLAIVFGSVARGEQTATSDLDIAVAAPQPLPWQQKMALMESLALAALRPIDVVDLQSAHGLILNRALAGGSLLFCGDRLLYARLLSRMLFEEADFGPLRRALLAQRRKAWIEP